MNDDFWGEPVSAYTRQQAIEDGVLVDVTALAKETGFRIPVAFTAAVWSACDRSDDGNEGTQARAHDVLWMAILRIRSALQREEGEGSFPFQVIIERTTHRLWVVSHPAKGFTIGLPEDF